MMQWSMSTGRVGDGQYSGVQVQEGNGELPERLVTLSAGFPNDSVCGKPVGKVANGNLVTATSHS